MMCNYLQDARFDGIRPFRQKIWLSSPTMHGEEQYWVDDAIRTNWVSTVGSNINEIETQLASYIGVKYAVALSAGTAALHLAARSAGERLYGQERPGVGTLAGRHVFCSDMTFEATVNPVTYEGGEAVFIDTERDTWNMDPSALERAFELYPDTKLVIVAHLYGTPGKMDELKAICDRHGALIIEDAAESLGAKYKQGDEWIETGAWGNYNCISFNGNKIITGSAGGMFLTNDREDAAKIRKWSTQSREDAPWYQHEEVGYNYRMSNVIAGVVRGQIQHLDEHMESKKTIYGRYRDGLKDLPVSMNPFDEKKSIPNFWLSCLLINPDAMAPFVRGEKDQSWQHVPGKSSPGEILSALAAFGAEGRPIWKPMHMQPVYRMNPFVTANGDRKRKDNGAYGSEDVGADIFGRGLCLPSDNKMTAEQQDVIIDIIHRCFR